MVRPFFFGALSVTDLRIFSDIVEQLFQGRILHMVVAVVERLHQVQLEMLGLNQ